MKNLRLKNISVCMLAGLALLIPGACSDDNDGVTSKYPAPVVTSHFPDEAFPTGIVTIKGSEFGNERTERIGRVYFGGVEATEYVSWSDNEIQVRVPEGAESGDITVWVWKNNTTSTKEFNVLPGAVISDYDPSPCYPNTDISLSGRNFEYFIERGVTADDITVEFPTETNENGVIESKAVAFDSTSITVHVPDEAKGGDIYVRFGDWQRVKGPNLSIIGDIPDYYFSLGEYVKADGNFSVGDDGVIGSTKRGAYFVYDFTVPVDGFYDIFMMSTTNQSYPCYVNVDMGTDPDEIANRAPNVDLYNQIEKLGWANMKEYSWGDFKLKGGKTYYMRIYLWAEGTSWVCNLKDVRLKYIKNPTGTPIDIDGTPAYNLYECDFNSDSMLPFSPQWTWDPNYIKTVDNCVEFYYNYAALAADNRRERRGCELISDFATTTEGWYGFKIFLPEGKFPMDQDGIIVSQLFNNGCKNSWAGHLSIDKGVLKLSHRHALVDPVVGVLGTLETNKWYDVIVYFKVGRNNKGNLKAWFGDDLVESKPAYDSGAVSFGFGHWLDDDTLDDTNSNQECIDANSYGGKDYIGSKFGLYVQNPVDITLRMDDIKALEGNPAGAFNIVRPQ